MDRCQDIRIMSPIEKDVINVAGSKVRRGKVMS